MNDPDMGAWIYTYDALGQLKSQRDAKLQTTTMNYDVLGRMTKRTEPSLISDFYFDKYADNSACNKGIGKLCEVKSQNNYRRKHYYDTLGRAYRTDYYHDSTSSFYQVNNTYDGQGRIDTVTYPAVTVGTTTTRLQVKNNYNAAGYLFKITNTAGTLAYWTATAMDADGHVTTETLGNGLSTTRTYQATTARLTGISTGAGGSVQNLTYTYDTIGNLMARTDTFSTPSAATINETFTYDVLNRLKTVTMSGTTTLNKSYNYDEIGNIIYKSDLGGTGVLTYPASGATSVRPHAVSNVNGTIGGVVNPNYTYDGNGNLLTSLAGTRTFTYASFNMPTRIDRGTTTTSWIYDADHNRTQELTNTPATGQPTQIVYVNPGNQPFFEKLINISGTGLTEYRHFIGGVAIYTQKSNATNETKYLLKDRLGSTNVVTSSANVVLERFSYDAFGKTRNLNGSNVTTTTMPVPSVRRGFTGHEMLAEFSGGFIHMNGRLYDPNLGRFMTADPTVQFEGYSQSYNRYSYVLNNPLGFTDPTGFGLGEFAAAFEDSVKDPFKIEKSYYAFSKFPGMQDVSNFMMQNSWARSLSHSAASKIPFAGWAVNAYLSGYDVWYQGGTHADIERAWVVSIGSWAASKAVSKYVNADDSPFTNALLHAPIGCAAAAASDGDCGRGAAQSFALTLASNYLPKAIAYLQSESTKFTVDSESGAESEPIADPPVILAANDSKDPWAKIKPLEIVPDFVFGDEKIGGAPGKSIPKYKRPTNSTTKAQRQSVQGKPCTVCGNVTPKQFADHIKPLVKEHYETGTVDLTRMRSVESVQPNCPSCSGRQGADLRRYSIEQREIHGH